MLPTLGCVLALPICFTAACLPQALLRPLVRVQSCQAKWLWWESSWSRTSGLHLIREEDFVLKPILPKLLSLPVQTRRLAVGTKG